MAQSNDAGQGEVEVGSGDGSAVQPEGDDSGSGGEEDGSDGSADGRLHGMMLMSSTHHRFAGLFTIRKPGALPVTQLLVRGSPAMWGQKCILVLQRVPSSSPMALGGLQARGQQPGGVQMCSRVKGKTSTLGTLLLARPACRL